MARNFLDFIASLPEARQQAIHEEAERLIAEEMTLRDLRKACACSQRAIADRLGIKQAAVSKIEHRADMYISTLRDYLGAADVDLEIMARLPDGRRVRITQFEALSDELQEEEDYIAQFATV